MNKPTFNVKKGALHKALGIAPGKTIPPGALMQAAKSKSPVMRKRVQFAINAKKFNHKHGKSN